MAATLHWSPSADDARHPGGGRAQDVTHYRVTWGRALPLTGDNVVGSVELGLDELGWDGQYYSYSDAALPPAQQIQPGMHVQVEARDLADQYSPEPPSRIVSSSTTPVITAPLGPIQANKDGPDLTVDLAGHVADPNGQPLTASWQGEPPSGTTLEGLVLTVSRSEARTESGTIRVTNRSGAFVELSVTIEISSLSDAVAFTSPVHGGVYASGAALTVTLSGVDAAATAVRITADRGAGQLPLAELSDAGEGLWSGTVTVSTNEPPQVTETIALVTEPVVINLDEHFADPNGDELTYAIVGASTSAALSGERGQTLTIAAPEAVTETVTVEASDGTLTATLSFQVSLEAPVNEAPVLTYTAQTVDPVYAGETVTFLFVAEDDAPIELERFSATVPAGAVAVFADLQGGDFECEVASLPAGDHTISITYTDAGGLSDTISPQVRVELAPPSLIEPIAGGVYPAGQALMLTAQALGLPDEVEVECAEGADPDEADYRPLAALTAQDDDIWAGSTSDLPPLPPGISAAVI